MKKTTKKILSIILVVMLSFACVSTAFATGASYANYDNTVTAFEGLKYNAGYQKLCVPEYTDYIDAVLAANKLPRDLDASEQYLVDEATANILAAKAELLTEKFMKAPRTEIDEAFAQADSILAALGDLTAEQQAQVDALKAELDALKADKDNVSVDELNAIIAELEAIKNYVSETEAADYAAYDYSVTAFEALLLNKGYQALCIPAYADYIKEVLAANELPRDLTVKDQALIDEAVANIAAAKAELLSDTYLKASAADIEAAFEAIDAFIAGLDELTEAEQAEVDALKAIVDEMKANAENVSVNDLAILNAAFENLKYALDDTRPADYSVYDIEVTNFSNLRYNKAYIELCTPDFVDYIDSVLAAVELPRDLTVKDQHLIDAAVEEIKAARAVLISDEYMKADKNAVDSLIAELEKVLGEIGDIADEIKDEVEAAEEMLEELKNNKDTVSKNDLAEALEALEELKELIKEAENAAPADYTDYDYWYAQITARARHPFYTTIFVPEYTEIAEAFIAEVTLPRNLKAYQQGIIDEAVAKLLAFDEMLKNEAFREIAVEEAEAEAEAEAECDCICHKTNPFSVIIFKLIAAFRTLFGMKACDCCA